MKFGGPTGRGVQPTPHALGKKRDSSQLVYRMELNSVKPCGQCTSGSKIGWACLGRTLKSVLAASAVCSEAFATVGSWTAPAAPAGQPGRAGQALRAAAILMACDLRGLCQSTQSPGGHGVIMEEAARSASAQQARHCRVPAETTEDEALSSRLCDVSRFWDFLGISGGSHGCSG